MSVVPVSRVAARSDPARVLPTISLTEDELEYVQKHADGRTGTGYESDEYEHNTNYGNKGESRYQHLKGIYGEAAVAKYYENSVYLIDDDLFRHGDDGKDVVFHRDVTYDDENIEDGKIIGDVKTTPHGYSGGKKPILKINRHKLEVAPNRIYILCELVNHTTVRIVGYIHSSLVPQVGVKVDEGEWAFEDKPDKKFKSKDDNWAVEPEHLTAVWRTWQPEDDV